MLSCKMHDLGVWRSPATSLPPLVPIVPGTRGGGQQGHLPSLDLPLKGGRGARGGQPLIYTCCRSVIAMTIIGSV